MTHELERALGRIENMQAAASDLIEQAGMLASEAEEAEPDPAMLRDFAQRTKQALRAMEGVI